MPGAGDIGVIKMNRVPGLMDLEKAVCGDQFLVGFQPGTANSFLVEV